MNRTYQKSSFIKYLVWVLYVYPRVAPKFFRWRAVTSGKSLKSSYCLSLYRGASKDKAMVMDTGPQCTDLESQTAAWCFLILIWRLEIRLGKAKQFACTFQPSGGRAWPGIHIKLPMWPCIMSQWRRDCQWFLPLTLTPCAGCVGWIRSLPVLLHGLRTYLSFLPTEPSVPLRQAS